MSSDTFNGLVCGVVLVIMGMFLRWLCEQGPRNQSPSAPRCHQCGERLQPIDAIEIDEAGESIVPPGARWYCPTNCLYHKPDDQPLYYADADLGKPEPYPID